MVTKMSVHHSDKTNMLRTEDHGRQLDGRGEEVDPVVVFASSFEVQLPAIFETGGLTDTPTN